MNEEELQVAGAKKNEGVVGQGENSFENFRSEAAVCSLSQEEQSKAVEKVTLVDQDSVAPVNIVSSTPADQVITASWHLIALHWQNLVIFMLKTRTDTITQI
jgi:hypothetical protein